MPHIFPSAHVPSYTMICMSIPINALVGDVAITMGITDNMVAAIPVVTICKQYNRHSVSLMAILLIAIYGRSCNNRSIITVAKNMAAPPDKYHRAR